MVGQPVAEQGDDAGLGALLDLACGIHKRQTLNLSVAESNIRFALPPDATPTPQAFDRSHVI